MGDHGVGVRIEADGIRSVERDLPLCPVSPGKEQGTRGTTELRC